MNHEQLRKEIIENYANYSRGFKAVAKVIIDQPHHAAIKNITSLGHEAGVSPATVLRFITSLRFSGYSQFQSVFKKNLVSQFHDYQQTLSGVPKKKNDPYGLLYEANQLTIQGMNSSIKQIDPVMLKKIANRMNKAKTLHLCAFRRMYPVCVYLYYTLTHMGRSVSLIDGYGGMHEEQARQMSKDDMLLVISYANYSVEAKRVSEIAKEKKAQIVAVTDSELSPLCEFADIVLLINDISMRNIRLPTVTLNTLQSLCLSLAFLEVETSKKKK